MPAPNELAPDWPLPDEAVLAALEGAYADGSWGKYDGPNCQRLVERLRNWHGIEHVLLCSSGTIAVELALRGLKVGPGDEVIVAAYDFPGNFRAIEAVGARPVLVDLAPGTWTLDVEQIPAAVSRETKAVIASHLHGTLAPMPRLVELARRHSLAIVEDACQSPGGTVGGRLCGNWGDVAVHSFGGSKLLTSGRGGAIVTPHADVAQRIKIYSERGNQAFPLSELQAAVLPPQMDRLAERNARRLENVLRLEAALRSAACGLEIPLGDPRSQDSPAFYKLGMLDRPALEARDAEAAQQRRQKLIAALQAEGLAIDEGFRGFARRSASRCRSVGDLAQAQAAAAATVLLHHPVLLSESGMIERVAQAIIQVARALA